MKVKIDKQEFDVDIQSVANFLFAAVAAMRGEDVPEFIGPQAEVDALSLVCVAAMLQTDAAKMLMQGVIEIIDDFVGESGGVSAAIIRIRNDLKRSGS